jgi:crotonobetainyl-CoA:carnitine CoA-transferase CaiB-like acyl-CoA transferase
LDQVAGHPQTEAVGMLQTSPDGSLRAMGLPLSFDGERPPFARMAPGLGEDNDAVLGPAGPEAA